MEIFFHVGFCPAEKGVFSSRPGKAPAAGAGSEYSLPSGNSLPWRWKQVDKKANHRAG
jgi:hypothetical protein